MTGQVQAGGIASAYKKLPKGRISMNRITATISIAAAFAAGCGVTHLMQPARAAAENITAQIIHTQELEGDALSPAASNGMRNKTFVAVDGATVSIQDGNTPKHLHPNANE